MLYILLTALFIFIMIFIFRDDDEGDYNRKESIGRPKDKTGARKHVTPRPPILPITYQEPPLSWGYLDSLMYDNDLLDDVMETEIVGLQYYCMPSDRGLVNGTVRPEPDNPHDPRAQVVIRADGKKLGYVPEKDNIIFARLMDAGKLLKAKIIRIEHRGSFMQISVGIYLVDF